MRAICTFLPVLVGGWLLGTSGCTLIDSDVSESELGACSNVPRSYRFEHGGDGHADPLGAAKASQARAGRVRTAQDIATPADARHRVRPGDFVLANEKVAVYIEAEGNSDGYLPFGGEVLAIEPIGPDGRPTGVSHYGEAALMFGLQTVSPDRVSVIADGSDGGPAIIRSSGRLKMIPVLDAFLPLFPDVYDFPAALDYVLEPGANKVTVRVHVANTTGAPVSFDGKQSLGVFQSARSQRFTEGNGFAEPVGSKPFIAWDSGVSSFLLRSRLGPLEKFLGISGLEIYKAPAVELGACETKSVDYFDLVAGGPGIDGVLEAKREGDGEAPWREVRGVVREAGGGTLAGAMVHATSKDGYLTRTIADANGNFMLHVPPGAVSLTPTLKGWATLPARALGAREAQVELTLPKRATLEVNAVDATTNQSLPVRVQVVSEKKSNAPDTFGIKEEPDDRLYREYVVTGRTSLPVPPGNHRVVVSRGFEYEVHDAPIVAAEGLTTRVQAALRKTVDSPGVMCADFHIHSIYSVDSTDTVETKVKSAIADGLEIPVSSEHEYVIDFQPVIRRLGMDAWAFGMASEELTTFSWGHFGVFPLSVQPEAPNQGAVDWYGKLPPQLFPEIAQRPEKPLVIVNHPRGDSGYFELSGFDRQSATGSNKELWTEAFHAVEVFNESDLEANRDGSVGDWFALLNAGKKRTAVGSSDSHYLSQTPVGYPRTCLYFGHEDPRRLEPNTVRDVLRAGTAVVNGGITMTVEGPGGVLPGGKSSAGKYRVVVSSPSWISPSSLEVFIDGASTRTIALVDKGAPGEPKRYELLVDVAPTQSRSSRHWVVFHAKGEGDLAPVHPGKKPFAVSNPIYF